MQTSPQHHTLNYVELTVRDLHEARAFYHSAFGWNFNDYGSSYAGIIGAHGAEVGGLFETTECRAAGGPLVLLYSTDLSESVRAVESAGGTITVDPYHFPGGKRFHFTDPSGNELGVWAAS